MVYSDNFVSYLLFTNLSTLLLFLTSEFLSTSTKYPSNGVIQFISRRLACLGGRRVRIDFRILSVSVDPSVTSDPGGASDTSETPLLHSSDENNLL